MTDKKEIDCYKILFNMARTYKSLGQAGKAKYYLIESADYYLKAASRINRDLNEVAGRKHPMIASAYNNIATVYSFLNQKEKSDDYYRKR